MKYIKSYKSEYRLESYIDGTYEVTPDGINVDGNFKMTNHRITKIPWKFNIINGNFDVSYNRLETLENSPTYVKKNFDVSYNRISSLKYSPNNVGSFSCLGNNISKSKGFPKYIKSFCYINLTNDSDLLNIEFDFINGVEKLKNIVFPDNEREYIINMFNCNFFNLLKKWIICK